MKITRSQKDAVISLLKEKYDEKQKIANEEFLKSNKSKIQKEIKAFKDDEAKLKSLLDEARELYLKWNDRKGSIINNQLHIAYGWYYKENSSTVEVHNDNDFIIKYPKISVPDYGKVERQLELDTLGKDFDLDKFIQQYL